MTRLRVTEGEAGAVARSQCPQGSAWLLRKWSVSSGLRNTWGRAAFWYCKIVLFGAVGQLDEVKLRHR